MGKLDVIEGNVMDEKVSPKLTIKHNGNLLASRTATPQLHSKFISGHFYFSGILLQTACYQILLLRALTFRKSGFFRNSFSFILRWKSADASLEADTKSVFMILFLASLLHIFSLSFHHPQQFLCSTVNSSNTLYIQPSNLNSSR